MIAYPKPAVEASAAAPWYATFWLHLGRPPDGPDLVQVSPEGVLVDAGSALVHSADARIFMSLACRVVLSNMASLFNHGSFFML